MARCPVLSAGDVRGAVERGDRGLTWLGFSDSEWALTVTLLRGLTGGTITDVNCADTPLRFVPDVTGAA